MAQRRCSLLEVVGAVVWMGVALAAAVSAGVIVEKVQPGQAFEKAGVKAGDEILALRRAAALPANPDPASVEIASAFDVPIFEVEQSPRGAVTAVLRRDGQPLEIAVPIGYWGVKARPVLSAAELAALGDALQALRSGDVDKGRAAASSLGDRLRSSGHALDALWVAVRASEELVAAKRLDAARAVLGEAVTTARSEASGELIVELLSRQGAAADRAGDLAAAEQAYGDAVAGAAPSSLRRADALARLAAVVRTRGDLARARSLLAEVLTIREQAAPDSFEVANALTSLGIEAFSRGALEEAGRDHERALTIREKVLPGSSEVAQSMGNLAVVMRNRGNFSRAEELYRRALAIQERLDPGGAEVARVWNNLGVLQQTRGDLVAGSRCLAQALAIREKLFPDSLVLAGTLTNMGIMAYDRGDLVTAEEYHRRALEIRRRIAPGSLDEANSLNELGNLALDREQLDLAKEYFQRDLALREKAGAGGPTTAATLRNLAEVARRRGDLAAAAEAYEKARAIDEAAAPGAPAIAADLAGLADVAQARNDGAKAEALYRQALTIREAVSPGGLEVAVTNVALGAVLETAGKPGAAAPLYERAIAITGRLAPGSRREAEALHALALLRRGEGKLQQAVDLLARAVAALESQKGRLGGGREATEAFSASFAEYYRELVQLEVKLSRHQAAFADLERFRARILLTMLAERDLDFSKDAPPELLVEQRTVAAALGRAFETLAALDVDAKPVEVAAARTTVAELQARRAAVAAKIKAASPHLAALQDPQPVDLDKARAILGPDTLLLSYCTASDATTAFVVLGRKLEVLNVALPRSELAALVRGYRRLLAEPSSDLAEVRRAGKELGGRLLRGAEPLLGKARRVVICADGPLHLLPFAALVTGDGRFLLEHAPVISAASVTVLGAERRSTPRRSGAELAAFGDPTYPGTFAEVKDVAVRAALRGVELTPLPATRAEVEAVAGSYPGHAVVRTGGEAREEAVKALGPDVAIVHLACHGILDSRLPLESGLALAIPSSPAPGQDNGLLQAWEILESVRLDADLVTLSACETGLGADMGGEGLVGLNRAFQFAGARTVVSTLWSVADESTADLMRVFYSELARGRDTASSLRTAQLRVAGEGVPREGPLAGQNLAHPFFWAAFTITGDWR